MKAQRYVSYVVGMLLIFPIRVFHFLSPENVDNDQRETCYGFKNRPTAKAKSYPGMKNVKRTCGQSQRSARLAQKEKKLRRK